MTVTVCAVPLHVVCVCCIGSVTLREDWEGSEHGVGKGGGCVGVLECGKGRRCSGGVVWCSLSNAFRSTVLVLPLFLQLFTGWFYTTSGKVPQIHTSKSGGYSKHIL